VERARAERPTGLRRLEKLDLWEISVVTFPMLPGARVERVKASTIDLAGKIRSTAGRLFS
jgi:phage head maturation protease